MKFIYAILMLAALAAGMALACVWWRREGARVFVECATCKRIVAPSKAVAAGPRFRCKRCQKAWDRDVRDAMRPYALATV